MKPIIKIVLIILLNVSFLHTEDLTSKYKQMMTTATAETMNDVNQIQPENLQNTKIDKKYNFIERINKIQNLKQDTFESTKNFNIRVNSEINLLQNEVKFFAKNRSKKYSAGTASMKSYDADREKMKLSLKWNGDLKSVFPEIKNLKTVTLDISNNEAKALFEKQKKHYFYIDLAYVNSKLVIFKIILNDIYQMKPLSKQNSSSISSKNNKTSLTSDLPTHTKVKRSSKKRDSLSILNWFHPKSEPRQLYIVTFRLNEKIKKYRVYCPTGMVRDITGKWKKARKAYSEDNIRYENKRVLRKVFDTVCN
jgi:hypothetical protein